MKARVALLLLAASVLAFAGDNEFDRLVKGIESQYGVKRTHIPLMGVANFFVKVIKPAGAKGFKIAIFEDLDARQDSDDPTQLDGVMKTLAGGGLRPLIRTHKASGEATYIYTQEIGKDTRMLIATFERREATVVEVTVDAKTLFESIGDPMRAGKYFGLNRSRDRDRNRDRYSDRDDR